MELMSSTSQSSGLNVVSSDEIALVPTREKGLTLSVTVLMIAGTVAGSGILALPRAMEATGWVGMPIIICFGSLAAYTGSLLGWSWEMVESRYIDELGGHTQNPYALLGEKAFGKPGRIVVKVCIYIAIMGAGVVFLLLAADLAEDIVETLSQFYFSSCYLTLVVGAVLTPMCWLGTPTDFWPMGVAAIVSTGGAGLIIAGYAIYLQGDDVIDNVQHSPVEVKPFFMALGSVLFTFAGHPGFPTIQQDMRNRNQFGQAVALAFAGVACMYLTVTITTYLVLGNVVESNVLDSLSNLRPAWPVTLAEIMILVHLISGYIVLINPVSQDLEQTLNIPNRFCVGRVLVRTAVMCGVMFTAESIPRFGALLSLVGGSVITMLIFVMPVCIYERLARYKGTWGAVRVPVYRTLINVLILIISVVVMVTSTFSALEQLSGPDTFVPPCYINISRH